MAEKMRIPRWFAVACGFAAFIAVSALMAYWAGGRPSPREACARQCVAMNKQGQLVYKGPATDKDLYKQVNSVCECR